MKLFFAKNSNKKGYLNASAMKLLRFIQFKQVMKQVYLLVPLLTSHLSSPEADIERTLSITSSLYELHQFDEHKYAVELTQLQMGYQDLIDTLNNQRELINKTALLEQALKQHEWSSKQYSMQTGSIDSLMKKAVKYKEVKQENRKLKKLLQNQLENTQKVREQTQRTMKVLREQFDTLVRQMNRQVLEKDRPGERGSNARAGEGEH